jgi:hypothetical protein
VDENQDLKLLVFGKKNPQALDQLEEWMKENPIPYISNDKFSQEVIFDYWDVRLPGHTHVNQTYVWCR